MYELSMSIEEGTLSEPKSAMARIQKLNNQIKTFTKMHTTINNGSEFIQDQRRIVSERKKHSAGIIEQKKGKERLRKDSLKKIS
jgi:hypothetical protein